MVQPSSGEYGLIGEVRQRSSPALCTHNGRIQKYTVYRTSDAREETRFAILLGAPPRFLTCVSLRERKRRGVRTEAHGETEVVLNG